MRRVVFTLVAAFAFPAVAAAPVPNIWGDACRAYRQHVPDRIDRQVREGLKFTDVPKSAWYCVVVAVRNLKAPTELQCMTEETSEPAQIQWDRRVQRAMELCQPAPAAS